MTEPGDLAEFARHQRAVSERALEIELELRQQRIRWAPVLCSCHAEHPAQCQVHGAFLIMPDGRVV